MEELLDFVSPCPACGHARPQDGYTYAGLRTLLGAGAPIEAYCVTCDEIWPVARGQRIEIARRLAVEETISPLRPRVVRPHRVLR